MYIFRVEHFETGKGPLAGSDIDTALTYCYAFKKHLAPRHFRDDGFDFDLTELHYFGWSSFKLMKEFFNPKHKKLLHNSPFVVSVYEIADNNVNTIVFPDGQIAFRKCDAILVDRINIKSINMVKRYN